jgi:hypothetical protein
MGLFCLLPCLSVFTFSHRRKSVGFRMSGAGRQKHAQEKLNIMQ